MELSSLFGIIIFSFYPLNAAPDGPMPQANNPRPVPAALVTETVIPATDGIATDGIGTSPSVQHRPAKVDSITFRQGVANSPPPTGAVDDTWSASNDPGRFGSALDAGSKDASYVATAPISALAAAAG